MKQCEEVFNVPTLFHTPCFPLQATSLKLGAEKEELEAELTLAGERTSQGEPPTEDCEREWYRMERTRMVSMRGGRGGVHGADAHGKHGRGYWGTMAANW